MRSKVSRSGGPEVLDDVELDAELRAAASEALDEFQLGLWYIVTSGIAAP